MRARTAAHLREVGDRRGIAFILEGFAGLAAAEAQPARAICLASAAASLRRIIGAAAPPSWRTDLEHRLEAASTGLSREAVEDAGARGRGMSLPEAVVFALGVPETP